MTDRLHAALASAIADLEWFRVPHTVDRIVGLHAEAVGATTMRWRHGVTNADMVSALKASGTGGRAGKGGHADPTPDAALAGWVDDTAGGADSLAAIDHTLDMLEAAARELDHLGADAAAQIRWHPPVPDSTRQGTVGLVVARLHHATPNLAAAHKADPERVDELVRLELAEPAAWLHTKALDIWEASRGETRPVVVQRPRITCETCTPLGREVVPERGSRCNRCKDFIRTHKLKPTAKIVRWWEDHPRTDTPPRLILEARAELAAAKRKARERSA